MEEAPGVHLLPRSPLQSSLHSTPLLCHIHRLLCSLSPSYCPCSLTAPKSPPTLHLFLLLPPTPLPTIPILRVSHHLLHSPATATARAPAFSSLRTVPCGYPGDKRGNPGHRSGASRRHRASRLPRGRCHPRTLRLARRVVKATTRDGAGTSRRPRSRSLPRYLLSKPYSGLSRFPRSAPSALRGRGFPSPRAGGVRQRLAHARWTLRSRPTAPARRESPVA